MSGLVSLVGAGPGDPALITVRGLELVRHAEVLVYDRLVATEIVAEAPAQAIRISRERLLQEEVNDLLVRSAREGLAVVRLKGGDPFVFGRGGEEALALAEAGIPFQVVPGVSSLSAVPMAAGIPITHRGISAQVTAVSGHSCDGEPAFDYATIARTPGTVVLFMALGTLAEIARELVVHGRDPSTPSAVIARGTLPGQEVVVAPLGEIASAAAALPSPALVVIGDVVALHNPLYSQPLVQSPTPQS